MERLRQRGDDAVPVDIRDPDAPVDILDGSALTRICAGADGVVHLAAISRVAWGETHPDLCDAINVDGTRHVLEAARAAGPECWVVHASSREIYGDAPQSPVTEDAPKHPVNRYGQSKLESEHLVDEAAQAGMRTAILRLSSVYGGRQDHPDRVIPALTWRALQGEQLVITGADTFFDFVHVEDTVDGILAAID
ncbi:SDR family oxidoreductase, partial [Paracoccus aestuarii]